MIALSILVENKTSRVEAMITWATIGAVLVVHELSVDLTVDDLGFATIGTEDTNTISGVNGLDVLASIDSRATSEHNSCLSHLVRSESIDLGAFVVHIECDDTISRD